MSNKSDAQMSLNLPAASNAGSVIVSDCSTKVHGPVMEPTRPNAAVYSFAEIKAAKERSETAKLFGQILQLVRHFR